MDLFDVINCDAWSLYWTRRYSHVPGEDDARPNRPSKGKDEPKQPHTRDKIEPNHSNEMEMSVLGSVMLLDAAADEVFALGLRHQHFYRPAHQRIWCAIQLLRNDQKPTRIEFVIEKLTDMNELCNVGNDDYLMQLAEYVPSPASARYYAEEVIKHWTHRQFVKLSQELVSGEGHLTVPELMARTEGIFRGAMGALIKAPVSKLKPLEAREAKRGIRTPLNSINRSTYLYGIPVGQMVIISAYHKGGKTALALQIAEHAVSKRYVPFVIYGTFADLGREDIEDRIMKMLTGYSTAQAANQDGLEVHKKWVDEANRVDKLEFIVYDASFVDGGSDVETFLIYCENEIRKMPAGTPPPLIVCDYAQEMTSRMVDSTDELKTARVVASKLGKWAGRNNAGLIVLSQITEGQGGGRAITKGSRVWEEKAGLVLRIADHPSDENMRVLEVPYNRFGKSKTTHMLDWLATNVKYQDSDAGKPATEKPRR